MLHHRRIFAIVVPVLLLLDQATKVGIRHVFEEGSGGRFDVIPSFFSIVHVENRGAAWGLFANSSFRIGFFAVVTLIAFGVILNYYRKLGPDDRMLAWSLSAIFAGAAGNFIDRMTRGQVTDFLDFYATGATGDLVARVIGSAHWPAFNVADIAICVGVGLFAVHVLFVEPRRTPADTGHSATPGESVGLPGVDAMTTSTGAPRP